MPGRAIKFTANPPQVALSEEIICQKSFIQLSPNPFTKILKIYLPEKRKAELEIFNLSGQRIKNISVAKGIAFWQGDDENRRNLPLGVYIIKIKGEKEISKIIKIK